MFPGPFSFGSMHWSTKQMMILWSGAQGTERFSSRNNESPEAGLDQRSEVMALLRA